MKEITNNRNLFSLTRIALSVYCTTYLCLCVGCNSVVGPTRGEHLDRLRAIAGDPFQSVRDRQVAVLKLINLQIRRGDTMGTLAATLENPTWLRREHIQPAFMSGSPLVIPGENQGSFKLAVLCEWGKPGPICHIDFVVEEAVHYEEIFHLLKGESGSRAASLRILDFRSWEVPDSDGRQFTDKFGDIN